MCIHGPIDFDFPFPERNPMPLPLYLIPQNPAPYRRKHVPYEIVHDYYADPENYDPVLRYHCGLDTPARTTGVVDKP